MVEEHRQYHLRWWVNTEGCIRDHMTKAPVMASDFTSPLQQVGGHCDLYKFNNDISMYVL